MRDVKLTKGLCGICNKPIPKDWSDSPSLGSVCRDCSYGEKSLFQPDDLEFVVKEQPDFRPLYGIYKSHYEWTGTKVMINGKVGTIQSTQGDLAWVDFGDKPKWMGTPVSELGYWDLLKLYRAKLGLSDTMSFPFHYVPKQPANLLDKPILPVTIREKDGAVAAVVVGERPDGVPFRMFLTIHAFVNYHMRRTMGLAMNHMFEGGFTSDSFEVRNLFDHSSNSTYGIGFTHREVTPGLNIDLNIHPLEQLLINHAQTAAAVTVEASAREVAEQWKSLIEVGLRFPWKKRANLTIQQVWRNFCRMQDVFLNVLTAEEIAATIEFAREKHMDNFGLDF